MESYEEEPLDVLEAQAQEVAGMVPNGMNRQQLAQWLSVATGPQISNMQTLNTVVSTPLQKTNPKATFQKRVESKVAPLPSARINVSAPVPPTVPVIPQTFNIPPPRQLTPKAPIPTPIPAPIPAPIPTPVQPRVSGEFDIPPPPTSIRSRQTPVSQQVTPRVEPSPRPVETKVQLPSPRRPTPQAKLPSPGRSQQAPVLQPSKTVSPRQVSQESKEAVVSPRSSLQPNVSPARMDFSNLKLGGVKSPRLQPVPPVLSPQSSVVIPSFTSRINAEALSPKPTVAGSVPAPSPMAPKVNKATVSKTYTAQQASLELLEQIDPARINPDKARRGDNSYSAVELKDFVRNFGLKVTGNKKELAERLMDYLRQMGRV